ncbi:MAG: hypothetical protein H7Y86_13510 [Rhizobacter sp.]|nr:hypothetical protein [Ferruginibacter sp.]
MQQKNIFQKAIMMLLFFITTINLMAQQERQCGTKPPLSRPLAIPDNYQRNMDITGMRMLRLYVIITKPTYQAGTPAQDEHEILAHLEWMRQHYAPYGICFILQGMEVLVSDELNVVDPDSNDDFLALQAIANQRPTCMTIFVHGAIEGNVAGTAWGIPSTFVSLEGSYTWSGFPVLASHEIGHALGLLHTFETYYGKEAVNRTGSCVNCDVAGDLLCDTPADKENVGSQYFNSNCEYLLTTADSCGNTYLMAPANIMSYHLIICPTPFHLTAGQGARMNYTIDNTQALLNRMLTINAYTTTLNQNLNSGYYEYVYRNNITINAPSYNVGGSARVHMSSGEIDLKPGTTLSTAGGNGIVVVRANALCQ